MELRTYTVMSSSRFLQFRQGIYFNQFPYPFARDIYQWEEVTEIFPNEGQLLFQKQCW